MANSRKRGWILNVGLVAVLVGATVLAGCSDDDSVDLVQPVVAATTPPPGGPVLLGKGVIKDGVKLDTGGPASFSVRTITVPPGGATGWHRHDGAEMSIVTKGALTVVRENRCDPVTFGTGDAVFIPAGTAHLARNDGSVPAEAVVTYLLKPDAPDRAEAPDAC